MILFILIFLILLLYYLLKKRYDIKENFINNYGFKNVIMTTYFCKKKDPQRNKKANSNDINYIKPWYNSMKKLGLNGIIFHDGLGKEFIKKYQTNKIKFEYINTNNFKYSLNDLRFFVYYDYILNNKNIENVFMTDGNDVKVVSSPFNKFDKICVGSEESQINKNQWIQDKINSFNDNKKLYFKNDNNGKVYNAGILGGNRKNVLFFLEKMINIFKNIDEKNINKNNNMIVFNYIIYIFLNQNVITGEKLHSKYRKFENNRKDICFIHK